LNRRSKDKPVEAKEATAHLRSMDELEPAIATMQDRGFWAAYDSVPSVRRILIEPCAAKFVERLRELHARGEVLGQVSIQTATERKFLYDPEREERTRFAIQVIREAKARGDEKALGRFRRASESDGLKRGPKVNPESNRLKIEMLHALAEGKQLKQSVSQPKRKPNSASAELSRYCRDFYGVCRLLHMETREAWQRGATGAWRKEQFARFGFSFPKDFAAAEEAYRRGHDSLIRHRLLTS
jgi:hypothetical protein